MKIFYKLYGQVKRWVQGLGRIEKSVILTLLSLFLVVLLLTIIQLKDRREEEFIEIISEEEFVDIEKIKELEQQEKWKEFFKNAHATSKFFNEANKKIKHKEEPFKSLDQIKAEKQINENSYELPVAEEVLSLSGESAESLKKVDRATAEIKKENSANKNSYVRYNLTGREPLTPLPNPIYVCDASGKIVVEIIVNSDGKVIKLKVNSEESTSSNGCLTESALLYASKAQFDRSSEKEKQSGSITYYFQGR